MPGMAAVAIVAATALGVVGCSAGVDQGDPSAGTSTSAAAAGNPTAAAAGTLTATEDGASWTASFGTSTAGVVVAFQVGAIPTTMTGEVAAPEWLTLATATTT